MIRQKGKRIGMEFWKVAVDQYMKIIFSSICLDVQEKEQTRIWICARYLLSTFDGGATHSFSRTCILIMFSIEFSSIIYPSSPLSSGSFKITKYYMCFTFSIFFSKGFCLAQQSNQAGA